MNLYNLKEKLRSKFGKKGFDKTKKGFCVEDLVVEQNERNDNEYTNYQLITARKVNLSYEEIVNMLYSKYNNNSKRIISFARYINKEKNNKFPYNKMKRRLQFYFKLKNISIRHFNSKILYNFTKTDRNLTKQIEKIESVMGPIFSYKQFKHYGIVNYQFLKKINRQQQNKIENMKPNKVDVSQISKKEEITYTPLEELKSSRRKLLYKIRKMEKTVDDNNLLLKRKKLLMDKKTILELEKMILENKQNDDIFQGQIDNSQMIRKQNAQKCVNNYFKLLKNGKVTDSIEDYFGLDQLTYFKSLGIDLLNLEKNVNIK